MSNLSIWEAVQKTDPAYTKQYKGAGGFQGTAINATYLNRRATEIFGPCGVGWGYSILEDRFDAGGPLEVPEGHPPVMSQMHTIKLRFWYMQDGERREIEHYGHTPFVTKNKFGIQTDMEAPKKSLTDALKKCMSMLGFAGDIFMGLYDDVHYVNEMQDESAIARAENKIEEKERQAAEYREWLEDHVRLIGSAQSMNELQKLYTSAIRKLDLRKDETGKLAVTRVKDSRKSEIESKEAP